MNSFIKIFLKIIGIHIFWEAFIVTAALNTASFNHIISAVSFFLIEPINLFIVYPVLIYKIIYRLIQKDPYCIKSEKEILTIFSIICTIVAMGWVIKNHIEEFFEDGFGLFLYLDHWLY